MNNLSRRELFRAAAGLGAATWLTRYHALAATHRGKAKITDIKVMVVKGPRTYTWVRVDSDTGVHGIGEAYGIPGAGVKEPAPWGPQA